VESAEAQCDFGTHTPEGRVNEERLTTVGPDSNANSTTGINKYWNTYDAVATNSNDALSAADQSHHSLKLKKA
jgi:hypothetical protein